MLEIMFRVWENLPSRIISLASVAAPTWFTVFPKDFNKLLGLFADPTTIRLTSIAAIFVFAVYWLIFIYFWKKVGKMANNDRDLKKIFGVEETKATDDSASKPSNMDVDLNNLQAENNESHGFHIEGVRRLSGKNLTSNNNKGSGFYIKGK